MFCVVEVSYPVILLWIEISDFISLSFVFLIHLLGLYFLLDLFVFWENIMKHTVVWFVIMSLGH